MKENKDGQTHYQIPIELTDREIEALQEVVDYAFDEEYKHCEEMLEADRDEETTDPDDVPDTGHIYYQYRVLSKLLNRINEKK